MRNLLALVGALVVGFGGVGWYLNWYHLNVAKSADGTIQVQTNFDTNKFSKDAGDGMRHVGELIGSQLERTQQEAKSGSQPTPVATPGPITTPQTQPEKKGGWLFGPDFATPTGK